jgi:hypothetical protein
MEIPDKFTQKLYLVKMKIFDDESSVIKSLKIRAEDDLGARCLTMAKYRRDGYELTQMTIVGDPERYYKVVNGNVLNLKNELLFELGNKEAAIDMVKILDEGLAKEDDETKILSIMKKMGWEL